MFDHETNDTLDRLSAGSLRVTLPVPSHLVRRPRVAASTDFFATANDVPLEPAGPDGRLAAALPVTPGDTLQYRFSAAERFSPRTFHADNGGANFSFHLPAGFAVRAAADPAGTLFALLDRGLVVAVAPGALPDFPEPVLLVNLLGPTAWSDAETRIADPGAMGEPVFRVLGPRFDAFFADGTPGLPGMLAKPARPTVHFTERLVDPRFPARERYRAEPVAADTALGAALAEFDRRYWYPIVAVVPWRFPGGAVPAAAVPLLADFFARWADALLVAGRVVLRDGARWDGAVKVRDALDRG